MIKVGNSPVNEATNPLASQVKKGDWVVIDLNPKVAGLVQLIPVKVASVNGRMFRGWAWNEREHEYNCSQIRFIGNSEKSTDNFIMDNERKSSKELKDSIMNESKSDPKLGKKVKQLKGWKIYQGTDSSGGTVFRCFTPDDDYPAVGYEDWECETLDQAIDWIRNY